MNNSAIRIPQSEFKVAIVALNTFGKKNALKLKKYLSNSRIFISKTNHLSEITKRVFKEYDGIIFCMALGIVVRVIAPYIKDKYTDPAVVVVDDKGRFAISVLSGHEGGANNLAIKVSNILSAEPVVTTASESKKNIIVGIGCRRGVKKEEVIRAIKYALAKTKQSFNKLRYVATIDLKQNEIGLKKACLELGVPLKVISFDLVKNFNGKYNRSDFVQEKIGVQGVCEPCALLAARRPKLILSKQKIGKVTVALAKEV